MTYYRKQYYDIHHRKKGCCCTDPKIFFQQQPDLPSLVVMADPAVVGRISLSSSSSSSFVCVMHDTFNVILWTSADIFVVMQDDLGWKNRTTRYILPRHWLYEWFSSAANVHIHMRRAWRSWMKKRTEQHIVIGFGELAEVD